MDPIQRLLPNQLVDGLTFVFFRPNQSGHPLGREMGIAIFRMYGQSPYIRRIDSTESTALRGLQQFLWGKREGKGGDISCHITKPSYGPFSF